MFSSKGSFGFLLSQVVRENYHRMHMLLGQLGLYPGQPPILFLLWQRDGRTQKELGEAMQLRPATVTVMLQRMEKAGLVARKADNQDLRVSRVYLTEQGKNIRPQVEETLSALDQESLTGFSPKEREQLVGFLLRIRDNLAQKNT
jgi:DNA-binding MarR family transcriptional regulator